jgi:diguanylate cyclase (GGDEF)-like protein
MHTVTLRFLDEERERAYGEVSVQSLRTQARLAVALGIGLYLLVGILDPWFVPPADRVSVWLIRGAAVGIALGILGFTLHSRFQQLNHGPISAIGLNASIGLMGIMLKMPAEAIAQYYVSIVIVIFWTYLFLGVRFVYGLAINVGTVVLFYSAFGLLMLMPPSFIAASGVFLFAASVVAGGAAYTLERQRRELFVRELDIDSERKRHQVRALHDRLTGLPNRELLDDRIAQAIAMSLRDGRVCAGFYVDLDGFKEINDTFGHDTGDIVLRIIADRLRANLRNVDTVARLGGDEFFVLAPGIASSNDVRLLAEKMLHLIRQPIQISPEGPSPTVSASIGIALFPYRDCSVHDIIQRADHAMYAVKRAGKGNYALADTDGRTAVA